MSFSPLGLPMATSRTALSSQPSLLSRLGEARARTDALFELLPPNSFYERPIAERHRLIFYLGHLEAYRLENLHSSAPLILSATHDEKSDKLFAFGIDPVGDGLPTDVPADWPTISEVEKYKSNVRSKLDERLGEVLSAEPRNLASEIETLLHVAIEHRLMHAETIAYLLHNLPLERKVAHPAPTANPEPAPRQRMVTIPAGIATLGQVRDVAGAFGWDNEFDLEQIPVPAFAINAYPVTNFEYLRFRSETAATKRNIFWKPEDWQWKSQEHLEYPHFWAKQSSAPATDPDVQWEYRGMFGNIPLPTILAGLWRATQKRAHLRDGPGNRSPRRHGWHRAAYGTPSGAEQLYPWGDEAPDSTRGNFHHTHWDPTPVDAYPTGASAFDVWDLLGNGWGVDVPRCSTRCRDSRQFPFYPGYSANFFDGKHFVMKGGSPRTDACMLRTAGSFPATGSSPHYPHVYATFPLHVEE